MRRSSCVTSSKASSQVASRNGSYQEGGVATRSRRSRSSRSSSGSSRTDLPTARGGPAGFPVCPSPSIVRHGPPRRSWPAGPFQTQRSRCFTQPRRSSGFVSRSRCCGKSYPNRPFTQVEPWFGVSSSMRSEEHTSELQSPCNLVCRLLLEKKKTTLSHVEQLVDDLHLHRVT